MPLRDLSGDGISRFQGLEKRSPERAFLRLFGRYPMITLVPNMPKIYREEGVRFANAKDYENSRDAYFEDAREYMEKIMVRMRDDDRRKQITSTQRHGSRSTTSA